jgi:3-oxoacyl-[acyl-carrier-protein] synthase II
LRRVALTGLGLLTPLGNSPRSFMDAAMQGTNCVRNVRKFDAARYGVRFGAEIEFSEDDQRELDAIETEMPQLAKWCLYGARKAVADAGIELPGSDPYSVAVVLGNSCGATEYLGEQLTTNGGAYDALRPATAVLMSPAAAAVHISRELGLHGEVVNVTSACASTASAIAYAARMIRDGDARCVITGGAEESISPLFLGAFGNSRALSRRNDDPAHASRPYDRERDGYVLSDATCILILEDMEDARRRGARIYCEIAGVGCASDAYSAYELSHCERPGAVAVQAALNNARCNPDEVSFYSALGVSVPSMDIRETRMLKSVFGEHARNIWISSVKSMMGHSLGASGSVQTTMAALAIHNKAIPPTINYEWPDPECDLDYVPNQGRERASRHGLVYAVGNNANVAMILKAV